MTNKIDVEGIIRELDNLANIYGWHKETCAGHSHHPACPAVKLRHMLTTLLTQAEEEKKRAIEEESDFLRTLYVTSPSTESESYSDSVTELECFQDGFDDAKNQIESKIRKRLQSLTPTISSDKTEDLTE